MLNTRDNYKFVTPPADVVVDGGIMPLRGEADQAILRGEDVSFLLEGAIARHELSRFAALYPGYTEPGIIAMDNKVAAAPIANVYNNLNNALNQYSSRVKFFSALPTTMPTLAYGVEDIPNYQDIFNIDFSNQTLSVPDTRVFAGDALRKSMMLNNFASLNSMRYFLIDLSDIIPTEKRTLESTFTEDIPTVLKTGTENGVVSVRWLDRYVDADDGIDYDAYISWLVARIDPMPTGVRYHVKALRFGLAFSAYVNNLSPIDSIGRMYGSAWYDYLIPDVPPFDRLWFVQLSNILDDARTVINDYFTQCISVSGAKLARGEACLEGLYVLGEFAETSW